METNEAVTEISEETKKLPKGIFTIFIIPQVFMLLPSLGAIMILLVGILFGSLADTGVDLEFYESNFFLLFIIIITALSIKGDSIIIQHGRGGAKLPFWLGVVLASLPLFLFFSSIFLWIFAIFNIFK